MPALPVGTSLPGREGVRAKDYGRNCDNAPGVLPGIALHSRLILQESRHPLRIARDDVQIGFGRLVGLATSLLPVAQRADRDVVARREFFLGQMERAPYHSSLRHAPAEF